MKKQGAFLLAILLLLLAVLPGASAVDANISVFSVEATEGVNYDGYLVSVRDNLPTRAIPLSLGIESVTDTLFAVDSIEDAKLVWDTHEIRFIEPNYEIELFTTPNDQFFPRQWDMHMINAPALWNAGITGRGVRIAIIDSGIRRDHEDFNPNIIATGWNYINESTQLVDRIGHGTGVTGIIAATRNNGVGMAGLLSEAIIIPLQVFDGSSATLAPAIRAINDAMTIHNADIINLSWGIVGGANNRALEEAIDFAANRGAIIIAAAGNDGTTANSYPAAFANVIGVGAVGEDGVVAYFSQRNSSVFVTAPGVDIITIGIRDRTSYVYQTGTSFSAPFVSAMAAAARSVNPGITLAQFRTLLQNSAVPQVTAGFNTSYGYGIINLAHFVSALNGGGTQPPPQDGVFSDTANHWARESIRFVAQHGLFTGNPDGTFAPNAPMSRAMFVTVLGRLYTQMGGTVPNQNDSFTDTVNGSWYSRYVAWAAERNIVGGVGGNRFAPDQPVSRQQAAAILARFTAYTGRPAVGNLDRLNPFIDRAEVAEFGRLPLAWAIENGIITGIAVSGGLALQPNGQSTRAQVAVILERYVQSMNISLGTLELDYAA